MSEHVSYSNHYAMLGQTIMTARMVAILLLLLIGDAAVAIILAREGVTSRPFVGWAILNLVVAGVAILSRFGSYSSYSGRRARYGTPSVTINGEKVKSRGEKLIADYFHDKNIRYIYEKPARTKGFFSRHISHPDFYLPDYNVHVEYWGLVNARDEETREEYVRSMNWKRAQYYNNDIKFISIYPHNLDNLDLILQRELRDIKGSKV